MSCEQKLQFFRTAKVAARRQGAPRNAKKAAVTERWEILNFGKTLERGLQMESQNKEESRQKTFVASCDNNHCS